MLKDSLRRWLRPDNYAETLASAHEQHISDLRVLLDKAQAREDQLAGMVKMVMEERYYRPVITGAPKANKTTAALPPEALSDVATFDEQADEAQSHAEGVKQQELQTELNQLLNEHAEAHKGE